MISAKPRKRAATICWRAALGTWLACAVITAYYLPESIRHGGLVLPVDIIVLAANLLALARFRHMGRP